MLSRDPALSIKFAETPRLSADALRPAVGILLLNAHHHVWIGQRRDQTSDAWQMPQGGMDPGETPFAAAQRELAEETSITNAAFIATTACWYTYELPRKLVAAPPKRGFVGQRQRWFAFRWLGSDDSIHLETATPEFSAWRWASPDDVVGSIVPFKRPLYEQIFRDFRELWDTSL